MRRETALFLSLACAFLGGCAAPRTDPPETSRETTPAAAPGLQGFADSLEGKIRRDLEAHLAADFQDQPPTTGVSVPLDSLQASLASTEAILAFHPEGDVVEALVITSSEQFSRVLDAPTSLLMARRMIRWAARPDSVAFETRAARDLYRELVGPFASELRTVSRLIIIPSGYLRGVPFSVLLMAEADPVDVASFAYLALRYHVTYEPTLTTHLRWIPEGRDRGVDVTPNANLPSVSSGQLPQASAVSNGSVIVDVPIARAFHEAAVLADRGAPWAIFRPSFDDAPAGGSSSADPWTIGFMSAIEKAPRPGVSAHRDLEEAQFRASRADPGSWSLAFFFGGRRAGVGFDR